MSNDLIGILWAAFLLAALFLGSGFGGPPPGSLLGRLEAGPLLPRRTGRHRRHDR